MSIYIDTSAIYAFLTRTDQKHSQAQETWEFLFQSNEDLFCNNYVLLETYTLLQSRFGMVAIRLFQENVFPVLRVVWLDEIQHRQAVSALLAANRRQLSLVDCSSFITMRHLGIRTVFAFDPHFAEQGFDCIP
jgi:predicted nucleic acid-binding protein